MNRLNLLILFALTYLAVSEARRYGDHYNNGAAHAGFSLFSVVKFKNDYCISQSPAGNGHNRHGLCFTESECRSRSGTASGTCATGFGVCCVFYVNDGDVTQNITFIRNEGYPNSLTGSDFPTYTVKKCDNDVCSLRLDFVNFDLGGIEAVENGDGTCTDSMTITSTTGITYPVICGVNTGHHVYIDFGPTDAADITIKFATDNANNVVTHNRKWEIKARQIECTNMNRPDPGCFQYLTAASGKITTFNWVAGSAMSTHLPNQDYTVCIRRKPGVCCIEYLPCDIDEPFSFNNQDVYDADENTGKGRIDTNCVGDYVRIQGGQSHCSPGPTTIINRVCGSVFNPVRRAANVRHVPICDCMAPFHVGIVSDGSDDDNTDFPSRGVCLNYKQIGC